MTLNGIDISNWQGDIPLDVIALSNPLDFVIIKATEGNSFVDAWCDKNVEKCKKIGLKWGFYHYLKRGINPFDQANYFYEHCKNYFGEGLPCLDWEDQPLNYEDANIFVRRIKELTGVWPFIYSWPSSFAGGYVESNCGRWLAQWPNVSRPDFSFGGEPPNAVGLTAAWQFCSDGRLVGYDGNLDLNYFYGTKENWDSYANPQKVAPKPPAESGGSMLVLENVKKLTIEY